jgi:hypothetical protein
MNLRCRGKAHLEGASQASTCTTSWNHTVIQDAPFILLNVDPVREVDLAFVHGRLGKREPARAAARVRAV